MIKFGAVPVSTLGRPLIRGYGASFGSHHIQRFNTAAFPLSLLVRHPSRIAHACAVQHARDLNGILSSAEPIVDGVAVAAERPTVEAGLVGRGAGMRIERTHMDGVLDGEGDVLRSLRATFVDISGEKRCA